MSKALHGQNKKTLISKKSSCKFYYFKFFIFLVTISETFLTLLIGKREQTAINGMILQKSFIVLQSQRHFEKENNVGKDGITILIQIWKGIKLTIFSKIIAIVFIFVWHRGDWTLKEDLQLLELSSELGNKWSFIAK